MRVHTHQSRLGRYTSADCDNGSNGCHQTSVLRAGALLKTVHGSWSLRGRWVKQAGIIDNRQRKQADQLHRAGCIAMVREAKQALKAKQLVSGNVKQHRTRPSQQQEPHHPSAAPHACGCWISNPTSHARWTSSTIRCNALNRASLSANRTGAVRST